jgi:ATPase family associated with various cellular activities (AAA)
MCHLERERNVTAEEPIDLIGFLTSFKHFMDTATAQVPIEASEPVFLSQLRNHFGRDPIHLPTVRETFEKADHPNLHLAVNGLLSGDGWVSQLLGFIVPHAHEGVKFSHLLTEHYGTEAKEGPVEYLNILLHDDDVLVCVNTGLYLAHEGNEPVALLISGPRDWHNTIDLEVMALDPARAERLLGMLRSSMRAHNVYRSHVVSLAPGDQGTLDVHFHHLPEIERDTIILPEEVLGRVERQTIGFSQLNERLKAAGRHIKRGLLLYGPPGTGKTLTAMYLAHQMQGRTTLLLTGHGIGLLERSCKMARLLQPATIILEDVDLIAQERTEQESGCSVLLFELLNQMDGLADDADILFLLTTNRPDLLEPALAARPGRIDQAIEIPLPDRDCRRRLFDLYGQGLTLRLVHLPELIDQTEGVSATFIRELIRKAALFSADESHESETIVVEDCHVDEALKELVFEGGELTKRLLGASRAF